MTRFADFNLDQGLLIILIKKIRIFISLDCQELHRLLTDSNIDEGGIIRILCNRSTGQRLQIRDKYKNLFNQVDINRNQTINSSFFSRLESE